MNMNFGGNDNEPRFSIDLDDSPRLAPREQHDININDVLCGRGKTSFNHGECVFIAGNPELSLILGSIVV